MTQTIQNNRGALFTAVLSLTALVLSVAGQAQLSFSLNPVLQSGSPGSELFFTGTLTNTSGSDLFLNSIQFNFNAPADIYLTGDDGPFYNLVPASLAASGAGATYTGILFGVNIASNAPLTSPANPVYTGTASLFGGANNGATTPLNSQNFQVQVTSNAVPEPGSFALLTGCAISGAGFFLKRRQRNRIC